MTTIAPRTANAVRDEILGLVREYWQVHHQPAPFEPGLHKVPYAGRVFDHSELQSGVESMLQFWLTAGPYAKRFEQSMKEFFGARATYLVNSGSSANLMMIATLCSKQVKGHLRPGDEVLTPAVTFPTTLTPILQHGLVPVFVDCLPGEYDVDPRQLEAAIGPRTRAIFVPHTVGIPCDMDVITDIAKRHDLWLLEDGCDALGATWDGKLVGTFGAMSSVSFYPAHHMTMGEGGLVVVNDPAVRRTALSIRDWGRDCWCNPGENDTCGMRFGWQLGDLPAGYDHKYIYSNLGYNLKATDMQAAIGCAQLEKLPSFIDARRANAAYFMREFARHSDHLLLPRVPDKAEPSWFGFPITVAPHVDRRALVQWLEAGGIETRLVFGGNILKQPAFRDITCRVPSPLDGTDAIMARTFFIGVYPGLTPAMREYVVDRFDRFFAGEAPGAP